MEAGSIFLILALALIVALFVGRPFFQPQTAQTRAEPAEVDSSDHRLSALLAERDRMLTALQELDFDHRLGKIPEEDYPEMRANLVLSAAQVLRRLDEFQGNSSLPGSVEDRIEQVIAARRADAAVMKTGAPAAPRVIVQPSDSLEELIATRRRDRQEKSAGFCPKCGKPALKSDRFCSRCGSTL
jgi:hypothetical protein